MRSAGRVTGVAVVAMGDYTDPDALDISRKRVGQAGKIGSNRLEVLVHGAGVEAQDNLDDRRRRLCRAHAP